MKPFKETKVGKFLGSKGVDIVLDAAEVIGVPGAAIVDKIKDKILNAGNLSPEDKKQALELLSLDQKSFEVEAEDRANARARQVDMAKTGKNDLMMSVVIAVGLLLWVGCVVASMFHIIPEANKDLFKEFSLTVRDIAFMIFAFYVGASKGGRDASKHLMNSTEQK